MKPYPRVGDVMDRRHSTNRVPRAAAQRVSGRGKAVPGVDCTGRQAARRPSAGRHAMIGPFQGSVTQSRPRQYGRIPNPSYRQMRRLFYYDFQPGAVPNRPHDG